MPSGDELIYSMEGSLWRQKIAHERCQRNHARSKAATITSRTSRQTARASVVTRYDGKASSSGATISRAARRTRLTATGGVNLEPRISPDGRQIVLVFKRQARSLQLKMRTSRQQGLLERALSRRAAREQDRPLLLFHARSRDQSVVVAGWEARLLRHERGNPLGYGLDLLGFR
jgi:Tol biopolymer transport system component